MRPTEAYMKLRDAKTVKELDSVGLSLVDEGHQWTPHERALYEFKVRAFKRLGSLRAEPQQVRAQ